MSTNITPPRFPILLLLAVIAVVPLNMFVPSLPRIAEDFGVDYAVVNISIGGYAVVMAVTQIIGGAMSDRYGRRPVALGALGIFTIASLGCVLAPNVYVFLGFRMAQGVAAACQAVALAAIRDTYSGPEMRSRVGHLSSAWAFGPMIGPTLGGILAAALGWRSIFLLFAVLGATAFAMVSSGFMETNREKSTRLIELKNYVAISRSGLFWTFSAIMALAQGMIYVYLSGAPKVAETFANITETHVGIFIGLVPAGFIIGSAITARTSNRIEPQTIILIGRIVILVGMLTGIALFALGLNHPLSFFLPPVTIGLGNGLTMPSSNAGVMTIAGRNAGAALGLASALTVTGAGLLSFVSGFVIQGENARESVQVFLLAISAVALVMAMLIYRSLQQQSMPR